LFGYTSGQKVLLCKTVGSCGPSTNLLPCEQLDTLGFKIKAMDVLRIIALWASWSALSIITVTSSRPSEAFQTVHAVSTLSRRYILTLQGPKANLFAIQNLRFLRSSKTAANASFAGFVIVAIVYITVLQSLALRYPRSAAIAVLTGFSLLLCEAAWEPALFTTAERLLVFLPLYLNSCLSWAVYSTPAPTASVPQWEADSKADSKSMLQNH
jgi:hypothetical protein